MSGYIAALRVGSWCARAADASLYCNHCKPDTQPLYHITPQSRSGSCHSRHVASSNFSRGVPRAAEPSAALAVVLVIFKLIPSPVRTRLVSRHKTNTNVGHSGERIEALNESFCPMIRRVSFTFKLRFYPTVSSIHPVSVLVKNRPIDRYVHVLGSQTVRQNKP